MTTLEDCRCRECRQNMTPAKPSWAAAPTWARFLAMDSDGWWFWYENRPEKTFGSSWTEEAGRSVLADSPTYPGWKETLEERP